VSVDRSDPYATLTGLNAFVSWSHSTEAKDGEDIPHLDDEPATQITDEPDETFVDDPHQTFIAEPHETFSADPDDTFVFEPEETFPSDPDETFVAEPAPMLDPEPVASTAAPARIEDERPVVWRAPAESQVIIFVVALRAIADAVEATLTSGGSTQWHGLEDALAHVRGSYERGSGDVRRSSIDVGGHDRPATDGSSSRIIRDGRTGPRRTGPSRRHNGPKPITWRAAGR
jgi:hypothetical protein